MGRLSRRWAISAAVLAGLLLTAAPRASAQADPQMDQGLVPYKAYQGGAIDDISLSTGDVYIHIPLVSFPQRGGKLTLQFKLVANSPVFAAEGGCNPYTGVCTYTWAPTGNFGAALVDAQQAQGYLNYDLAPADGGQASNILVGGTYSAWATVTTASGATHILGKLTTGDAAQVDTSYEAIDGSGWHADGTPTGGVVDFISPHGIRYFQQNGQWVREDPAGNQIQESALPPDQGGFGTAVDTLGRDFPASASGADTSTTGCTGPLPVSSVDPFMVPAVGGGEAEYKFCYAQISIQTDFSTMADIQPPSTLSQFSGTAVVLQSVVLPDGSAWTFQYGTDGNQDGQITEVDLPTGGAVFFSYAVGVPYTYNNYPYSAQASMLGTGRALDSDQVNPDQSNFSAAASLPIWWSYNPSTGVAVSANGNESDYTFTNFSGGCQEGVYQTEEKDYEGSGSGKALLRSVATAYRVVDDPYVEQDAPCPEDNTFASPISVTTSLSTASGGTATKAEDTAYDSGFTFYPGPLTAPYGEVVNASSSDYGGSGSPGPVLRQTVTDYLFQASPTYLNENLLTLPASVEVEDGSGNQQSMTQYSYDQTTPASSGVTVGRDPSGPIDGTAAGNMTEVSRWDSANGDSVVRRFTYNDTGTLASATDAGFNAAGPDVTQYSYSSAYDGAYRTETENPAVNGVAHQISAAYDFNTGLVTSFTDENGNTSQFQYDAMGRLTEAILPPTPLNCAAPGDSGCSSASGWTTFTYHDTPAGSEDASWVERQQGLDSGTVGSGGTDLQVYFDGLGRESYRANANGNSGWNETTHCYDAAGRGAFASEPFATSSPVAPSCGTSGGVTKDSAHVGDATVFDGLGRVTSVTHADGSTVLTSYSGAATEVQDEGNGTSRVTRVTQGNGLGQLTGVCEVTSATLAVGFDAADKTPAACNLGMGETGFLTTYGYDTLGDLTSVAQGNLEPRSFAYDSLGQLLTADNPETGTITYTYDASGDVLTRADARGITTTYAYDALHRVTGKTYSDGTPAVTYTYDAAVDGLPITNAIGRQVEASTANTEVISSYDAMGRTDEQWQCTPQNCGASLDNLDYGYDLLGDTTSASNGAGVTLSYAYNQAAQLTGVTSSLADAQHPAALLSAATYNAFGELASGSLGNGQTETDSYDARGRLASRSVTGASVPAGATVTISGKEQTANGNPATSGSGSVTVGGSEQSIAATSGAASVTITGSEQSGSTAATHATGSVSIGGSEQSYNYCYNTGPGGTQCQQMYQGGGVYVTINGVTEQGDYTQGSTAGSVASALASALNANDSSEISASASGGTVYFTTVATGTAANYSMSTSDQYSTQYWSSPSFTGSLSGGNMTGGTNASTYYDSGTVSITINGQAFTASYGQGSTTASVASALFDAIQSSGSSLVRASLSGPTISLTAVATGASSNYSLSASSATGDSSQFSSPSFGASPSGSAFAGGKDAVFDSGTVSITVDGFTASISYGQSCGGVSPCTAAALASGLAAGLSVTSSPVQASSSGTDVVSISSKTQGAGTNYSLSASSLTSDPSQFSSPSFSGAASGSSLTGGANATSITDSGTVWVQAGSFKATVNYGASDTAASVATNLAFALAGSGSPVTASSQGDVITLTTTASGSGADIALSAGSSTSDPSQFSSPSFTAAAGAGQLTGGGWGGYTLGGVTYAPDGDVLSADDSANGDWQYEYGPLNHLTEACSPNCSSPSLELKYAFDRFGNRWQQNVIAGSAPSPQLAFNANNQIVGASYDASGDMTSDGNGNPYGYDAEGRVVCVYPSGGSCQSPTASYVYNALGQRVEKLVGGAAKYYLYNLAGRAATTLDPSGNWLRSEVYAAGRPLATYSNGTTYFGYADWLGTERVEATATGGPFQTCTSLPFGDELSCSGPDGALDANAASPLHFTGQHHDDETGLIHFAARSYAAAWGRFMTPDWSASPAAVPYSSFTNPQTLDLYAYALGNPSTNADPDGHWCFLGRFGTTCPPRQPAKSADPTHPNNPEAVEEEEQNSLAQARLAAGEAEAAGTNRIIAAAQRHPLATQAGLVALQFVPGIGEAADVEEATEGITYVIGKISDLEADGALLPGEKTVASEIPDLTGATEQEKWAANSSALRRIMGEGRPIKDISVGDENLPAGKHRFLRAERNLLRSKGWTYRDRYWFPPPR